MMTTTCPGCGEVRSKLDFYSAGLGRRRRICSTCVRNNPRKKLAGEPGAMTAEERAEHVAIINAFAMWFGPVDRAAPLAWRP